ncbi:MAG: 16S rRNA processing protein RimM [Anaerolineales bacterium]|nr:16S rRNA processing protein RimM [Anaerolineales bacterium]
MMTSARNLIQADTGSPSIGEPVYLVVGRLRRPHGIRGEILMELLVGIDVFNTADRQIYVGDNKRPFKLTSVREHAKGLLIQLENLHSRDSVEEFRNQSVWITAADLPELSDGSFYDYQLIDLQVFDDKSRLLGTLVEVIKTGANDVYVVKRPTEKDLLLPAIPSVVLEVDLSQKLMKVHLIPGLVENYQVD